MVIQEIAIPWCFHRFYQLKIKLAAANYLRFLFGFNPPTNGFATRPGSIPKPRSKSLISVPRNQGALVILATSVGCLGNPALEV